MEEPEKSEREEELEARVRELKGELEVRDAEVSALRKIRAGYEKQISEYQYRTGEKQRPGPGITLKDYLDGLNNRKYNGKRVIIREAKISTPVSKRDWLFFPHYLQFTVHSDEAEASFIHWCPKKHKPIIKDILDSIVNTNYKIIVIAHNRNYFIEGIVKEDGKYLRFDDL